MIKIDDPVVYPGHGIGRVVQMETKELVGRKVKFYILRGQSGWRTVT
jgi:RNA polymerase-interacting CarD/CdnL/TRCF family regulator